MRKKYILIWIFFFIFGILIFQNNIIKAQKEKCVNREKYIKNELICLKCHKGKDSLENMIKKNHITTGEELFNVLRKGPKAGFHKLRTDEQIEQAIQYLCLPYKKQN